MFPFGIRVFLGGRRGRRGEGGCLLRRRRRRKSSTVTIKRKKNVLVSAGGVTRWQKEKKLYSTIENNPMNSKEVNHQEGKKAK